MWPLSHCDQPTCRIPIVVTIQCDTHYDHHSVRYPLRSPIRSLPTCQGARPPMAFSSNRTNRHSPAGDTCRPPWGPSGRIASTYAWCWRGPRRTAGCLKWSSHRAAPTLRLGTGSRAGDWRRWRREDRLGNRVYQVKMLCPWR